MVAMTQQTFRKTTRQMLRSLHADLGRNLNNPEADVWTLAEAVRQHAAIIVAECEREQEVSNDRH